MLDVEMACWMSLSDLAEACREELRDAGFCVSPVRPHSVAKNVSMSVYVSNDPAGYQGSALDNTRTAALFMLNVEIRGDEAIFCADAYGPRGGKRQNFSATAKAWPEAVLDMVEAVKPADLVRKFLPGLRRAAPPPGPKDWMPVRTKPAQGSAS